MPESEKKILKNGTEAYYLVNNTQPVIRLEIVFPAGKWYEPAKGVSFFVSKLLLEGTKNKSAKQIADLLDFYGASLECNQSFDWATLTLYCLSKHYKVLLELVAEILNEPAFPEQELSLLKSRTIQNLKVERKKPSYVAMEKFTQNVYGTDHPYTSGLDEGSIKKLQVADIKEFYFQQYKFSESKLFLCGDINQEIKSLTESLNILENLSPTFSDLDHAVFSGQQKEKIVIKDSLQSAVRVGKIFPLINDKDYLKLTVLNKILGGYFGSRLMKNIREDKGYTYGIHSSLSVRKNSTLFFIGSEVKVDKAELTLQEIEKEIKLLQTSELSEEELETVKNFMIGKLLNDSTTVFDQQDKLKHLIRHGLSSNHYSEYINTINSITSKEVLALSNEYLNTESLTTVYTSN